MQGYTHAPVIMACSPLVAFHCFFLFPQQLKATSKRTPHARVIRTANNTAFHTRTQRLGAKKVGVAKHVDKSKHMI